MYLPFPFDSCFLTLCSKKSKLFPKSHSSSKFLMKLTCAQCIGFHKKARCPVLWCTSVAWLNIKLFYHNIFVFESKIVANVPKSKEVWTINDSNGSIDFVRGILLQTFILKYRIYRIERKVKKDFVWCFINILS